MDLFPLMRYGVATWLVDSTKLTFKQIADFCGLHLYEVEGIANGDTSLCVKGVNPISTKELTYSEIARCESDPLMSLQISNEIVRVVKTQGNIDKKATYVPRIRRKYKPNAILWLITNHPTITDLQIKKLIGSSIETIKSIRNRTHWNINDIRPQDPVFYNICTQESLDKTIKLSELT